MYHRYQDLSRFVTDMERLKITEGRFAVLSEEEDYDIVVDLEESFAPLEELKPMLAELEPQISEMDAMVQKYAEEHWGMSEFPYHLEFIEIPDQNGLKALYWTDDPAAAGPIAWFFRKEGRYCLQDCHYSRL